MNIFYIIGVVVVILVIVKYAFDLVSAAVQ